MTTSKRNDVSGSVIAAYIGGTVLLAVGIYLATITEISFNYAAGQTSTTNPHLAIGIALAVIGLVGAGAGHLVAKNQLRK